MYPLLNVLGLCSRCTSGVPWQTLRKDRLCIDFIGIGRNLSGQIAFMRLTKVKFPLEPMLTGGCESCCCGLRLASMCVALVCNRLCNLLIGNVLLIVVGPRKLLAGLDFVCLCRTVSCWQRGFLAAPTVINLEILRS